LCGFAGGQQLVCAVPHIWHSGSTKKIKQGEKKAACTHGLGRGSVGLALVDVTLQFIPDLPSCLFKATKIEDSKIKRG
jgi:hypothetical protein